MANLMAAIELVMQDWRLFRLNNRQAYERISSLILEYQREEWKQFHS